MAGLTGVHERAGIAAIQFRGGNLRGLLGPVLPSAFARTEVELMGGMCQPVLQTLAGLNVFQAYRAKDADSSHPAPDNMSDKSPLIRLLQTVIGAKCISFEYSKKYYNLAERASEYVTIHSSALKAVSDAIWYADESARRAHALVQALCEMVGQSERGHSRIRNTASDYAQPTENIIRDLIANREVSYCILRVRSGHTTRSLRIIVDKDYKLERNGTVDILLDGKWWNIPYINARRLK